MDTRSGDSSFLRLLLSHSPRAERLRRRCAAVAAAVVLVAGLLLALGLGLLVLIGLVALAFVGAVLAVHERLPRSSVPWRDAATFVRQRVMRSAAPSIDDAATVEMAAVTPSSADRTVYGRAPLPTRAQLAQALARVLPGLQRRIAASLTGGSASIAMSPTLIELEGSRCNALGVALRRAGRADQAATLHEAARVIFAGVGESRGEALAANALGVALAEAGEQDAALEQFEQARTLLRELGDRQWEGKVLANIGLAMRRVGQDDEAVDLLQTALAKLSPETDAYRVVERQLSRAS